MKIYDDRLVLEKFINLIELCLNCVFILKGRQTMFSKNFDRNHEFQKLIKLVITAK